MANRMAGEIFVGGTVERRLLPDLLSAMSAEFVGLEWGDAEFSPETAEDLLKHCVKHHGVTVLRLCNDEACGGVFEVLESFLREHGIAFDRYSDGRYEYDPEWACFRAGTGLHIFTTNTDRERLFAELAFIEFGEQLAEALSRLAKGKFKQGISLVKATHQRLTDLLSTGYEPLPPFQIGAEPLPSTNEA